MFFLLLLLLLCLSVCVCVCYLFIYLNSEKSTSKHFIINNPCVSLSSSSLNEFTSFLRIGYVFRLCVCVCAIFLFFIHFIIIILQFYWVVKKIISTYFSSFESIDDMNNEYVMRYKSQYFLKLLIFFLSLFCCWCWKFFTYDILLLNVAGGWF